MRSKIRHIAFIAFSFVYFTSLGQAVVLPDSIKPAIDSSLVQYYLGSIDSLALGKLHHADSNLAGSQTYNPLIKDSPFNVSLGNLGLAGYSLFFKPETKTGFRYGIHAFDFYMFRGNLIRYYKVVKPYTLLKYANGPKKEQLFRVTHAQNLWGKVMFGLDFRFLQSFGMYERQKSDDKSFCINLQYFTPNKRYGIIGNYIHDKFIAEENGGIEYDSVFTDNLEPDRRLIKVNLNGAQNTAKYAEVSLSQYYYLSKPESPPSDTLDSIPVHTGKRWFHLGKVSHSLQWSRDQYLYYDTGPLSSFYSGYDAVADSNLTNDTNYVTRLTNNISWSNLGREDQPEDKPVYLYLGIGHSLITLGDSATTNTFRQVLPNGGFSVFVLKSFRLNFDLSMVLGDYNGGDIAAKAQIQQYLGTRDRNLGMLVINASYSLEMPAYFFSKYNGNNFRWDNRFSQQEFIIGKASYQYKKLQTGVILNQLKNYVYLNTDAHPAQSQKSFSVFQGFVNKTFDAGSFSLNSRLLFQKSTAEDIVDLPEFAGYFELYYTKVLFKGATTIQPGLSLYYNTVYFAPKYMPALKSFYKNDIVETGNYLIINLFFNVKIKRTRLFATYTHINSRFTGYNYIAIPHYPLQDGAFKFGLYWKFWD